MLFLCLNKLTKKHNFASHAKVSFMKLCGCVVTNEVCNVRVLIIKNFEESVFVKGICQRGTVEKKYFCFCRKWIQCRPLR